MQFDGTVTWDFRYDTGGNLSHHDIEPLPNGNVLMIAWERKTSAEAIATGRDPALLAGNNLQPDHIIEVQPNGVTGGTIVWEWHLWDHLIQDHDATKANYGDVGANPGKYDVNYPPQVLSGFGDWTHCNGIDYDPVHDWIVISARAADEIWVIDHSTTTAEAAGSTGGNSGKGGDFLYRWGNPAAYRQGTAADQLLSGQHAANFIPEGEPGAGNLLLFNNDGGPNGTSVVWELALPLDQADQFVTGGGPNGTWGPAGPLWSYSSAAIDSNVMSGARRLPNGNTLICSAVAALLVEVTPAGQVVWQHATVGNLPFHALYVERTAWQSRTAVSRSAGGSIQHDLVAGGAFAGDTYVLLGSVTGTVPGGTIDGTAVPLVFDAYTDLTFQFANVTPFVNTFGTLDGAGSATATFTLPPGLAPAVAVGLDLHHAFLVVDQTSGAVTHASNPLTVTIAP